MENQTTNDRIKDLAKEVYADADFLYSWISQYIRPGRITLEQRDIVATSVNSSVTNIAKKLENLSGEAITEPLRSFPYDDHINALCFIRNYIHGLSARNNPVLRESLEDLFNSIYDDLIAASRDKEMPIALSMEAARISGGELARLTHQQAKKDKQRRKDLKKQGKVRRFDYELLGK